MKRINGEEITIKELKNLYFGYSEEAENYSQMVDRFVVNGTCYTITEENDFIRFPINFLDEDSFPDFIKREARDENISVYNFINNFWGLDDFDLEEFDFYISI